MSSFVFVMAMTAFALFEKCARMQSIQTNFLVHQWVIHLKNFDTVVLLGFSVKQFHLISGPHTTRMAVFQIQAVSFCR